MAAEVSVARAALRDPASAFFAASPMVRTVGALLRLTDRVAPRWAPRGATRLVFTPLPAKLGARRPLGPRWPAVTWPFEDTALVAHRPVGPAAADAPAERPVVLLVHGWGGHAGQMVALGDALAQAGFEPVLLDLPGHGRSAGWRSSLPQFARAVHAAAARLGPLHAAVGHSLGALAVLHAAARGLAAQQLVLVAPPSSPRSFLRGFAAALGLPASMAGRMQQRIERLESVPLAEFEPEWLAARTRVPSLVVHDRGDRYAPFAGGEQLVAALPSARLHATDGLGHQRLLRDPGVVGEVRAWLGGAASPTSTAH